MKQPFYLILPLLFLLFGCSITKLQEKGEVEPQNFHSKLTFKTYKGVIGFEGSVNGDIKTFLFDTGADFCLLQRDSIVGKKSNFSGASKRKMKLGNERLESLVIGGIKFINTHALNGDFVGLKEQVPNFGGLIGQSIIQKANWLIDYPNKLIEISNRSLVDNTYKEIETIRDNGNNPYTFIEVNGKRYKVVIDLGSTSTLNLPKDSQFAKDIMNLIDLNENSRERYTLGGLQNITEKIGVIPTVKLGGFDFSNVDVNINTSSQPRIGINFFKDYLIYIDNSNGGIFKLKKGVVE